MTQASCNVLVVEDNLDAQFLVCEMLMALGLQAEGAAHAEDALGLLGRQRYDILFTDVNLPGMSGLDLAKRAVQSQPGLKVIFASGYGAGVANHVEFPAVSLPKPYDLTQLREALDAL